MVCSRERLVHFSKIPRKGHFSRTNFKEQQNIPLEVNGVRLAEKAWWQSFDCQNNNGCSYWTLIFFFNVPNSLPAGRVLSYYWHIQRYYVYLLIKSCSCDLLIHIRSVCFCFPLITSPLLLNYIVTLCSFMGFSKPLLRIIPYKSVYSVIKTYPFSLFWNWRDRTQHVI